MTTSEPNLINTETGDEYEWVGEPAGGGEAGYAHVADHDFAWSRDALEAEYPLVEVGSLDPVELARLRDLWPNLPEDGDDA